MILIRDLDDDYYESTKRIHRLRGRRKIKLVREMPLPLRQCANWKEGSWTKIENYSTLSEREGEGEQ